MLLPDTDEAGAEVIAARILQAVRGLKIRHEGNVNGLVTISAGVASLVSDEFNGRHQSLIESADRALYYAKDSGRNTVIRASAMAANPAVFRGTLDRQIDRPDTSRCSRRQRARRVRNGY